MKFFTKLSSILITTVLVLGSFNFVFVKEAKAAIAFVGSAGSDCAYAISCSVSYSPTAGNLVVVQVALRNDSVQAVAGVTDNASGGSSSYAAAFSDSNIGTHYALATFYVCSVKNGVSAVTANYPSAGDSSVTVAEYSGMTTSSCLDKVSSNANGSGTSQTSNAVSISQADEVLMGYFFQSTDGSNFNGSGGFSTVRNGDLIGSGANLGTTQQIVSSTGSYQARATTAGNLAWHSYIVTFKSAGAVSPIPPPPPAPTPAPLPPAPPPPPAPTPPPPASGLSTGYNPNYVGAGNGCQPGGTCYYIDYETGLDSNSGLSKSSPWKTAPGMACATGNAAAHTLNKTNQFILKGGVVWPYSCYPWDIGSGGAGTPNSSGYPGIYIGYDPTWNKGKVNSVRVVDPGVACGALTVNISGGGGSGASATAHIETDPHAAGDLSYVTVTNAGSGYTSNPTVAFSGSCTKPPTAYADIMSPVMDASAGVMGTASSMPAMMTVRVNYVTVDHLEFFGYRFYSGSDYVCGASPHMVGAYYGTHDVFQNLYVHNFVMDGPATASLVGCRNAAGTAALSAGGNVNATYKVTVNNSIFNNYESTNHGCVPGNGSTSGRCVQSTAIVGATTNTNNIINHWRGGLYTLGPRNDFVVAGNKMWAILKDANTQHEDAFYLMAGGITYNNILRDIFGGSAAFYVETNTGDSPTAFGYQHYIFNNVAWNVGASTPPIGWTAEFTAGSASSISPAVDMRSYNNTFYSQFGNRDCMNAGQWFGNSPAINSSYNFTLKNNHCISSQSSAHWFGANPGTINYGIWNGLTGPNTPATWAVVDQTAVVQSPAITASQGYTASNNYAPTSASNSTVTFASSATSQNLTSLCATSLNGLSLAALCYDILGNPRPASGGWQAGAYQYGGYVSPSPTPTPLTPTPLTPTPTPITPTPTPLTPTPNPSPQTGSGSSTTPSLTISLINASGTFYLIENNIRHGITNPGMLTSYGFSFNDARLATSQDLNLPQGPLLTPGDGSLVKSKEDQTVYLISNQKRYGFTSASVFLGLGFKFTSVLVVTDPEMQSLPRNANIDNSSSAHLPGLDLNKAGTVYWLGQDNQLHAYPSITIYNSWHVANDFSRIVPANTSDNSIPVGGVVGVRVKQ